MDRIHVIDFTKGILVVFMVIYHSLNYLQYGSLPRHYMAFLPASFIMITGFIITQIYLPKYEVNISVFRTRLAVRSLKLLLIFTFLNLGTRMVWARNHNGIILDIENFLGEWKAIYLVGSQWVVAFDVLLPISYMLFLSIFILRFQSVTPYFMQSCAIIIFIVCILMEHHGSSIYNLDLISSGVIGMTIGLLPLNLINGFTRSWIILSLLFVLYGCCVLFYGTYLYYMQIFSTAISLLIIYAIGLRIHLKNWFPKQTILLGKYSLLSYIIQIAYLKMFLIGTTNWNINNPNIMLTIILIMLVMWVTVFIVDYARLKYRYINRFYKMIFA